MQIQKNINGENDINEKIVAKRLEVLIKTLQFDIVEKYESGKFASRNLKPLPTAKKICNYYNNIDGILNKNIKTNDIVEVLKKEYNVEDINEIPIVLNETKSKLFIDSILKNSTPTTDMDRQKNREQVVQTAKEANLIVPREILDSHPLMGKFIDSIDVKKVQRVYGDTYTEYVTLLGEQIKYATDNEVLGELYEKLEELKKEMGNSLQLLIKLKKKNLNSKYQITLLLYNLIQASKIVNQEISPKLLDYLSRGEEDIKEAVKLLDSEEVDNKKAQNNDLLLQLNEILNKGRQVNKLTHEER